MRMSHFTIKQDRKNVKLILAAKNSLICKIVANAYEFDKMNSFIQNCAKCLFCMHAMVDYL